QLLKAGKDVVLVGTGPTVAFALEAAEKLKAKGVDASVVNHAFVGNTDVEFFRPLLTAAQGRLVTSEDHQVLGGMGGMLVHALVDAQLPLKSKTLGIRGEFGQSAYKASELYKKHK